MTPEEQQAKELADAIRALGEAFVAKIPAALTAMDEELKAIALGNELQAHWKTLHRQLHSMAGSAGTFGYDELGDRARELEVRINAMFKANDVSSEPICSEFLRDQRSYMDWVTEHFVKNHA